jgi:signal transduction histidine kinase
VHVLSRLSFRAKLLLVLFVPFLALVVVAAAGLSDRFTTLHAQEQYGNLAAPLRSLDDASRAIQDESVVSSWYVAGRGGPSAELAAARKRTDAAVRVFRADEQAFADAGLSEAASVSLTATNRGLDSIPEMRGQVDGLTADAATTRDFYLGVDGHLLDFGERMARDLASSDVSASLTRTFALQRAQHEMAREASVYIAVLASGAPQDFSEWIGAQTSVARYRALFTNTATPDELAAYQGVMGTKDVATDLPATYPPATLTPAAYYAGYQEQARALDAAINGVEQVVNDTASANASAALFDTRLYGGAAVFAMLLTLMLIWFVSNSLVGPLRRLTAAAREMSQRQLPALVESLRTGGEVGDIRPTLIEVTSEDEIGELAQAFNDVEAVTIEVAHEQSRLLRKGMGDLFVNLARRNQSLLERQLGLLDELERNEHDPAALDALFKLDHMATRMRRNAESLLVLSGAEQPRQWQQPIALIDVVRAAAAEIADFPRVELVGIDDDLAVSGRAVSDVAHLVAELLENATSFSPPDTAVVVSGAVTATGFVLAISDQGIGMPADRIAEANQLLAKPPLVGLALTRALGLHVVGSLAARHAISVELRAGAPVGMVALVALPTAVLEPRAVPAPNAPPRPPVYAPQMDESGEPEPLGARRVAWRPADEPPVEEWRREGLAGTDAAGPVLDEPSITSAPGGDAPTAFDQPRPGFDTPTAFDQPAPAFDAPPAFDQPLGFEEAPGSSGPPPFDPSGAPADPPGFDDQIPLATRVPGQHLSHQPTPGREEVDVDADPMRPYRVHELLTRHAQGKRRGRTDPDGGPGDLTMPTDPTMSDSPEMSVPDPFGHVQEDGR